MLGIRTSKSKERFAVIDSHYIAADDAVYSKVVTGWFTSLERAQSRLSELRADYE